MKSTITFDEVLGSDLTEAQMEVLCGGYDEDQEEDQEAEPEEGEGEGGGEEEDQEEGEG